MKIDYNKEQYVSVVCTDTERVAEALILDEHNGKLRVDMQGLLLTFRRVKPGLYATNHSGLEFTINTIDV